jgi:hypothetical protein
MVSSGSTKTVCPLELAPWTTPCTRRFCSTLDRDDEALAADGDQFILHRAAFGEFAQIAAQRFLNLPLLLFDLAADAAQFRRGFDRRACHRAESCCETAQKASEVQRCPPIARWTRAPLGAHRRRRLAHNLRHSAARSATRIMSRISVVSEPAPADARFLHQRSTSGRPANSKRPPTRRYSRISVVSCLLVSIHARSSEGSNSAMRRRPSGDEAYPASNSRRVSNSSSRELVC